MFVPRAAGEHSAVPSRAAQVQLILEFVSAVRRGKPLVKQMLMGGGKTTVVGPMLALMLGDGEMLVMQTMPASLLEQSKATLRATFSVIMRKRVFTLVFERSSELDWNTVEKLLAARRNRGVVLCTASTIKSIQLKLLEKVTTPAFLLPTRTNPPSPSPSPSPLPAHSPSPSPLSSHLSPFTPPPDGCAAGHASQASPQHGGRPSRAGRGDGGL